MLRQKAKPGITDLAQINGWRGETDTVEKMAKRVELDLDDIRNWSFWLDITIVARTLKSGFSGKNAF
jgi:putative colanic acid biosynthesis UDP-glucose lipid carrier transferase